MKTVAPHLSAIQGSLFRRLIVPMVLVGVLGVAALFVSALALQRTVAALNELHEAGGRQIEALQEIGKGVTEMRALALKHLSAESAREMSAIAREIVGVETRLTMLVPRIAQQEMPVHQEAQALAGELATMIEAYKREIRQALAMSADFEKEVAFSQMSLVETRMLGDIESNVQQLTRHAFEDVVASRESLAQVANRNLYTTFGVGLLGGVLLLGIAFVTARDTSSRLNALLDWSQDIAEGDFSDRQFVSKHDEISALTESMRSMVGSLAEGRKQLEAARSVAELNAEELRLYAEAFESSGEAMIITNHDNNIVDVNAAFTQQTGYVIDEVVGRNPRFLASGKTEAAVYQDMWDSLNDHGYWTGELWDKTKGGEIYPKDISISAIRNENGEPRFYIASFTDIRERKANEARIDYLAHHDSLTGLINRLSLETRLGQLLTLAGRNEDRLAVLFIDMDRFKSINDSLGHHVGDLLLIEVAHRLRDSVRESDVVARLGGDEFVVLLPGLGEAMGVAPVADKLLRILGQPYRLEGHELHSTPSIGVALFPDDGQDGSTLMKHADVAMYHAKERGRNNVQYFTAAMNASARERLLLENELRQALRDGGLQLHYQPKVCMADGRCCGVEALLRWSHPERGNISPLVFVQIAEESGLIEPMGDWVLDEACRQLATWKAEGIAGLRMAVNLSAKQLRSPKLADYVRATLDRHGLTGSDLELEITESVAMDNPERAISQLQALRDLGIHLAIDDFGTGYSSLAYLKRLPIQVLKLDRSFVRDIETDPSDAAISAATLALAHNLGLEVVAEGVETVAQRDFLVAHKVDLIQGFLYGRPLPGNALPDYLSHPPGT